MKLTTEKTGHHYLAEDGTVLNTKPDKGIRDSLGRTARALIVYDNVLPFHITQYFSSDYQYVYRHPTLSDLNSRDHVVKAVTVLIETGERETAETIARAKPKTETGYTPSQVLFFKAISSHFWSWAYFAYKLPGLAVFIPAWNYFCRSISNTQRTFIYPANLISYMDQKSITPSKWQKFCFKATLKTFAIFYTTFEIRGLKNKKASKLLLKVIRINIEKYNYVLRALTGQDIDCPDNWHPTRSNRWNQRLDITVDRDVRVHPEDSETDNLEKATYNHFCIKTP